MPEHDLYAILGVPRTATPDELKKAYRKAAKQFHPDVNPGNKAAEERFKEVTAASEVLSDPKRRALYDEFGPDALRTGFDEKRAAEVRRWRQKGAPQGAKIPFDFGDFQQVDVGDLGSFDFGTIFGDLFGGRAVGRGPRAPERARNTEAEIHIPLREAVTGAERDVRLDGKTLRVKIPPGVTDGSRIRLAGQGQRGQRGGPPGDLLLRIHLDEHPQIRRDGKDLYLDLPVTVPEALLGAEVRLPTFEGPVRLKIPPGSGSGTKLRLRGKGLPDVHGGPRGDLYAIVQIVLPPPGELAKKAVKPLADLYVGDPRSGISL